VITENRPSCKGDEILRAEGGCYGGSMIEPDPYPTAIPEAFSILKLKPNPAQGQVTIEYSSPEEETIQIRILDITGRLVMSPQALPLIQGYGEAALDLSRLNPGLYFVQMMAPELGKTHKLTLY
ncbi:MAG: T9SS type A sorting domain-containing protein, partial [Bacteroidota bacterium]